MSRTILIAIIWSLLVSACASRDGRVADFGPGPRLGDSRDDGLDPDAFEDEANAIVKNMQKVVKKIADKPQSPRKVIVKFLEDPKKAKEQIKLFLAQGDQAMRDSTDAVMCAQIYTDHVVRVKKLDKKLLASELAMSIGRWRNEAAKKSKGSSTEARNAINYILRHGEETVKSGQIGAVIKAAAQLLEANSNADAKVARKWLSKNFAANSSAWILANNNYYALAKDCRKGDALIASAKRSLRSNNWRHAAASSLGLIAVLATAAGAMKLRDSGEYPQGPEDTFTTLGKEFEKEFGILKRRYFVEFGEFCKAHNINDPKEIANPNPDTVTIKDSYKKRQAITFYENFKKWFGEKRSVYEVRRIIDLDEDEAKYKIKAPGEIFTQRKSETDSELKILKQLQTQTQSLKDKIANIDTVPDRKDYDSARQSLRDEELEYAELLFRKKKFKDVIQNLNEDLKKIDSNITHATENPSGAPGDGFEKYFKDQFFKLQGAFANFKNFVEKTPINNPLNSINPDAEYEDSLLYYDKPKEFYDEFVFWFGKKNSLEEVENILRLSSDEAQKELDSINYRKVYIRQKEILEKNIKDLSRIQEQLVRFGKWIKLDTETVPTIDQHFDYYKDLLDEIDRGEITSSYYPSEYRGKDFGEVIEGLENKLKLLKGKSDAEKARLKGHQENQRVAGMLFGTATMAAIGAVAVETVGLGLAEDEKLGQALRNIFRAIVSAWQKRLRY